VRRFLSSCSSSAAVPIMTLRSLYLALFMLTALFATKQPPHPLHRSSLHYCRLLPRPSPRTALPPSTSCHLRSHRWNPHRSLCFWCVLPSPTSPLFLTDLLYLSTTLSLPPQVASPALPPPSSRPLQSPSSTSSRTSVSSSSSSSSVSKSTSPSSVETSKSAVPSPSSGWLYRLRWGRR
jgi:hypothetical protein